MNKTETSEMEVQEDCYLISEEDFAEIKSRSNTKKREEDGP